MTTVEDQARHLLAGLPRDHAIWPRLRWVIRPDAFDRYRQRLADAGLLVTAIAAGEPKLFGIPYDFGRPAGSALVALMLVPNACAPTPD